MSVRLDNYNNWDTPMSNNVNFATGMMNLTKRDEIMWSESSVLYSGLTPAQVKADYKPTLKTFQYYAITAKPNNDTDWNPNAAPGPKQQQPVSYSDITNHNWWLRDGTGAQVHDGSDYILDLGKSGIKEAWLKSATSRLSGNGYDGVILDYFDYDVVSRYTASSPPTNYANNGVWYTNAFKPFIDYIIPGLQSNGYKVLGNMVGEYGTTDSQHIHGRSLVDGAIYEQGAVNWAGNGSGWLDGSTLSQRISAVNGDPLTYVWVDDGGLRSGIAAVEQKRMASLAFYYIAIPSDQSRHSYHHAYDWSSYWYTPWDFYIGTPAEDRVSVTASDGTKYAWSRKYTQGIVLLNYGATAASTATAQFTLDKAYLDANGTNYSGSVTLPPHTGLILQSAGR